MKCIDIVNVSLQSYEEDNNMMLSVDSYDYASIVCAACDMVIEENDDISYLVDVSNEDHLATVKLMFDNINGDDPTVFSGFTRIKDMYIECVDSYVYICIPVPLY